MRLFGQKKGETSTEQIHQKHVTELKRSKSRRASEDWTQRPPEDWTRPPSKQPGVNPQKGKQLTEREIEVLELVAIGLTNAEIGDELYLAEETIKSHMRHILGKLQARNRAHVVARGFHAGLLTTTSVRSSSARSASSRKT